MAQVLNPSQRLSAAILRVVEPPIALAPYFGAVLRGLVRRECAGLGTLAVTKDGVLLWDAAFVEKVDVGELAGVLVHEVMHIVLKHHDRATALGIVAKPTADAMEDAFTANIAMDCAINTELAKNVKLPGDYCMPEKFGMPVNKTFEEYYALLKKQVQKEKEKNKGGGDSGGESEGKDGKKPMSGSGWCGSCAGHPVPGEPEDGKKSPDGRSEADMERMRKQVAEDIQSTQQRGTVPASLQRWAEDYLKPPKVDWRTKLARLVRGAVAYKSGSADFTYTKMSRRQAGAGYGVGRPVIPAMHAPKPNTACVIDTSGSMGTQALSAALTEVRGVLRAVGAGVTVCICDAKVHGIKRVESIEEAAKMMAGGGGTAMTPALEAVRELKEKVSVCIVMTDGYIDLPPEPPFAVIWCIIGRNDSFTMPYGETVIVEEG
jgi:predicted metal-dependent peptidase